jgi:hypothetical protein
VFSRRISILLAVCAALAVTLAACGAAKPPESCGVGGTADDTAFAQHFAMMELVNKVTGEAGQQDPEAGVAFAAGDLLAIRVNALGDVSVRTCVQGRDSGGRIALDQNITAEKGERLLPLASFPKGSYVVRVIIDGVLVKNLPLAVK